MDYKQKLRVRIFLPHLHFKKSSAPKYVEMPRDGILLKIQAEQSNFKKILPTFYNETKNNYQPVRGDGDIIKTPVACEKN